MATTSKTIRVYSNSESVSHQPSNGDLYWLWKQNPYEENCYLDIDRKLFETEMRKSIGLRKMFEKGILSIKEAAVLEAFRLKDVDEYVLDKKTLANFIENSTVEKFEDFLKFAPQAMIDNIEVICTSKELTDRRKTKLFKEYTGKDLEEFYDDNANAAVVKEEAVVKQGKTARKKVVK
jgi:hypothetical protein